MVDGSDSMATDDRVFKTVSVTKLAELSDTGFGKEKQMHELIQGNLDIMFGLERLENEFRIWGDDGAHYPDTVAFDRKANTFVIIEYKNTLDKGVLNQAKAYLNHMQDRRDTFELAYIKKIGDHSNKIEFKWKAAYAIIVAPEFTKNQIGSAKDAKDLELYRIKRYDGSIIIMRRVGGAHKRVPGSTPRPGKGHPEPGGDVDAAEKDYLDKKGASDATKIVWHELKRRVENEIDIRFGMSKVGGGFYLKNRRLVCWVTVKSDRVELSWDIKKDQEIQTDDFITYYKTYKDGTKNYRACVDTVAYIANATRIIHTIYDLKSK